MSEAQTAPLRALAGKYLTFRLAQVDYGIEILKVREIIGVMTITRLPQAPPWIRGVLNLRGRVIPVMDLRVRFGLYSVDDSARTCIIVVQVESGQSQLVMGLIVDEVSEVLSITDDQTEPPPSFGAELSSDYMLGMGKVGQRVVILLDIDRALTESELTLVASGAESAS